MPKLFFYSLTILSTLLMSSGFAQTFFGNDSDGTTKTTTSTRGLFQPKAISLDEYKNAVNSQFQKYQQANSTQMNKELSQALAPPSKMGLPSLNPPSPPTMTQTTVPPSSPLPSSPSPISAPTPNSSQPSVYSGFGGEEGSKNGAKSSNQSSGWDINY